MVTAIPGQITHQHIINGVQQREPDQEEYNALQGMNGYHILLGVKHQCEGPENIERVSAKGHCDGLCLYRRRGGYPLPGEEAGVVVTIYKNM